MRSIAIIGAGQAGLQLGIGLKKKGYQVTLFTDRNPNDVLNGRIMSSQGMFDSSLKIERELNLNLWEETAPQNCSVTFSLIAPDTQETIIYWQGLTRKPSQAIDQRLKFSKWLHEFKKLEGKIVIDEIDFPTIDHIAQEFELTIVAAGKGVITQLFNRDESKSKYAYPQRKLACLYISGASMSPGIQGINVNIIPGVGEFFTMPGLTFSNKTYKKCEMVLLESIPGSAFDCWEDTPVHLALERLQDLLKKFVPTQAERFQNITLTDNNAYLVGQITPTIRYPVATLPSGKHVLGVGDAVVLNDPIAGQGANLACKSADVYLKRILEREALPFDYDWMHKTFDISWQHFGKWSTLWTDMLLTPPQPKLIEVANKLANGFDDPACLLHWLNSQGITIAPEKETIALK
jgi:Styrene monooxygenase A putative substrate binding domain